MASLSLIGLGLLVLLPSCNSRHFWKAVKAYDEARYEEATSALHQAVNQWPNDTMAWRMLGTTQLFLSDFEGAQKTYEAIDHMTLITRQDQVDWATSLMNQGKYEAAALVIEPQMVDDNPSPYATALWNKCEEELFIESDPQFWSVQSFDIPDISIASSPRISEGRVYFSSEPYQWGDQTSLTRTDQQEMIVMDLAAQDNRVMRTSKWTSWDVPRHDGLVSLSPDGRSIAFSRKAKDGFAWFGDPMAGGHQLLVAQKTASGDWSNPAPFPFVEKGYTFVHPTWSPDGTRLYFATDLPSPESQGGIDLWYSQRNGTFWEEPINLGPHINTPGDEVFPSFDAEGTLYFSSNGLPSLGGLDIYSAKQIPATDASKKHWRSGDDWTTPLRLPFPINTLSDDHSLALDATGQSGFVCSDRGGIDKIYQVELLDNYEKYTFTTRSGKNNQEVPRVPIVLIDEQNASAIRLTSDLNGSITIALPKHRMYRMEMKLPGYLVSRQVLSVDDLDAQTDLMLNPVEMLRDYAYVESIAGGKPFELALQHDPLATTLKSRETTELLALVDFLRLNPQMLLEIRTHEDAASFLDAADNKTMRVTKTRAIELESYLLKRGVSTKQLISVGKGADQLLNGCEPGEPCSWTSHAENRRTEFRVYGLLQRMPGQIDPIPFTRAVQDDQPVQLPD
tara:strand:+ start:6274 stop:8304 length:2031 start_codon:yes stop_codon:yes gene_type:complete